MMIRFRHVTTAALFMLVPAMLPALAQQAGNLQERMSAAEFYDAGLNKLSAQELATLNQWLATHQGAASGNMAIAGGSQPAAQPSARPTFADSGKREAFEAHIVGRFTGFTGDSLITLDNGQQWQQVGDDKPQCNSADSPAVKVKPTIFGNWLMNVPSCNILVHVRRAK